MYTQDTVHAEEDYGDKEKEDLRPVEASNHPICDDNKVLTSTTKGEDVYLFT
jgi:hypothetical protein